MAENENTAPETEHEADKAEWSAAEINDLPDSAFLYIQPGGEKDESGKTTPRALRHLPVKGPDGTIDLPHLRNAIARIPQMTVPGLSPEDKAALQEKARALLEEAQSGGEGKEAAPEEPPAAAKMCRLHMMVKRVDEAERIIEGWASTPDLDRQGEVVTQEALERHMATYMQNPVLLYNHATDKDIGANPIGRVIEYAFRDGKLWIRAQIAKGVDYIEERIWPLIKQGILNALSIGAPAAMVRKRGNRITDWPLAEISIVGVPANARATFSLVKSLAIGTDLEDKMVASLAHELQGKYGRVLSQKSRERIRAALAALEELKGYLDEIDAGEAEDKAKSIYESACNEVKKMEADEMKDLVNVQVKGAVAEALAAADKAKADAKAAADAEEKRVAELVEKRVADEMAKKEAPKTERKIEFDVKDGAKQAEAPRFKVFSPHDRLDTVESCIRYMLCKRAGNQPSEKWLRSLAVKAVDIAHRSVPTLFYADGRPAATEPALDLNALVPWSEAVTIEEKKEADNVTTQGVKQLMELAGKASEVAFSTYSGYGDQWVPTLMNAALWEQVRLEANVAPLFEQFDMPSQPYDFPTESTDPTVYAIAETSEEAQLVIDAGPYTDSKVATAKITFSAGKIGAISYWSEEFDEDSIIRVQPAYRQQYGKVMAHAIDYVLINGDETSDSTCISDYGNASIATTFRCLILDGLRHEPLVTTTTDKSDLAHALQVDDFKTVKALMGTAGKYALNPNDLVILADAGVAHSLYNLDEVLTVNNYGPNATVLKGQVSSIVGSPFIASEDFPLTDSSGYINNTGGSNTKGSFLVVRRDGWKLGWRRRPRILVGSVPFSDAFYILGVARFDLRPFATGMAALGYDLTV